jgi:glycosyltransferase 2 family protein
MGGSDTAGVAGVSPPGPEAAAGSEPGPSPAEPPSADRFSRLRHWWPTIRIVASVLMLGYLLHEVHLRSVFDHWDDDTPLWLAGGLGFTALGIVLSAVRWQRVLVAMDQETRLGPLVNAALASQFVSNFLPSTIGGDALRVTRLSSSRREGTPSAPAAFASVVLDRMSGWLILPLLCLGGLLINPSLLHLGESSRAAVVLSVVTLLALAVVVTVAASPRLGGRLAARSNWLRFMGAVHLGLDRIRRHPSAAAQVVGASLIYQLAIVAAGVLAARALGIGIGPTALLAFVPAVAIVQVMPVTIGGLGLREAAFYVFLKPLGVSSHQAIALGLVMYGMHLLTSLLGAPSFAFGNSSRRSEAASPVSPAA